MTYIFMSTVIMLFLNNEELQVISVEICRFLFFYI